MQLEPRTCADIGSLVVVAPVADLLLRSPSATLLDTLDTFCDLDAQPNYGPIGNLCHGAQVKPSR